MPARRSLDEKTNCPLHLPRKACCPREADKLVDARSMHRGSHCRVFFGTDLPYFHLALAYPTRSRDAPAVDVAEAPAVDVAEAQLLKSSPTAIL